MRLILAVLCVKATRQQKADASAQERYGVDREVVLDGLQTHATARSDCGATL